MARLARAVFPGVPHHVTQRGNGRARTFFSDQDYAFYRDLLAEHAAAARVEVWAWVLMPNHVHLILVPQDEDGLRRALAPVHRRYAGHVHARMKRTGHFWQGRFGCVAMDEDHLGAAIRYVALNPVRARLVERATDWPWSSIHSHLHGRDDGLTMADGVRSRWPDFEAMLEAGEDEALSQRLRRAETIGRPVGSDAFLARLQQVSGRMLVPGKRGRRRKELSALSP
ncbi:transposase [Sphingosinicella terrae]|uniref:transposase n=1 Tax=Sphingosinicella terrae TaxID=2172047 RepID=UPI000E0DE22F|nr:transposase [Sphingosinicella terrae]